MDEYQNHFSILCSAILFLKKIDDLQVFFLLYIKTIQEAPLIRFNL